MKSSGAFCFFLGVGRGRGNTILGISVSQQSLQIFLVIMSCISPFLFKMLSTINQNPVGRFVPLRIQACWLCLWQRKWQAAFRLFLLLHHVALVVPHKAQSQLRQYPRAEAIYGAVFNDLQCSKAGWLTWCMGMGVVWIQKRVSSYGKWKTVWFHMLRCCFTGWTGEIYFIWLHLGLTVCHIIAINSRRNLCLRFACYLYLYVYQSSNSAWEGRFSSFCSVPAV